MALRVAVAQMTSTSNIDLNFATCQRLAQEAAAAGVKLLSFPESFSFLGSKGNEALGIAEPLDGPLVKRYGALARNTNMWLSLGGFQEKGPDANHIYNTHVLLDDLGTIRSYYRKIHLFDVDVPGGPVIKESNHTSPGNQVVSAESPVGKLGLTILLVPSAFTRKTGEAHWETLLQARAIETQCYVLAAAQAGKHNDARESYGDAMIVDPWGRVIARCTDKLVTGIAIADIDHEYLKTVRRNMPIAEQRRYDIYGSDHKTSSL